MIQRDEASKRAWFTEGEKHSEFIANNRIYSDEENARLFSL